MNIQAPIASKVETIIDEIRAAAALPLARAVTIPREAYTDEDYFRFESRTVLESGWMCAAHVSEVKAPGDFMALELLGEPLLVVRDKAGVVRVLSRVCAHRAMDIMPEGFSFPRTGRASMLLCPYHHWAYNLDGRVRGCAQMQEAERFDKKDWRLKEFRSDIWKGFVFVNLDGKAPPLAEQYADFAAATAAWRSEEMDVAIAMDWECNFNWKVMVENWMESYHHLGAHHQTLNPQMPGQNTWTEAEHPHFIRSHLPFTPELAARVRTADERSEKLPGFAPLEGLTRADKTEWGLYLGYPCFMFLTMSDRVLWYRLLPTSAGHCKLRTVTLVMPENRNASDYAATVDTEAEALRAFHLEDMLVNTAVQRGLNSRAAVRGRLSHLEEPIWLIQRYLAARAAGTYPEKASRPPYYGPLAKAKPL
jgi:phenylpropionate dioxygenase-like ring-hydroxylating dioxygenase large terminal subunit